MMETCRESDTAALMRFLADEPERETTLGRLAHLMNRGVRYIHSLVKTNKGFLLFAEGKRVGSYLVAINECRVCRCTDDRACAGGCSWIERGLCSACATTAAYQSVGVMEGTPDPKARARTDVGRYRLETILAADEYAIGANGK